MPGQALLCPCRLLGCDGAAEARALLLCAAPRDLQMLQENSGLLMGSLTAWLLPLCYSRPGGAARWELPAPAGALRTVNFVWCRWCQGDIFPRALVSSL